MSCHEEEIDFPDRIGADYCSLVDLACTFVRPGKFPRYELLEYRELP